MKDIHHTMLLLGRRIKQAREQAGLTQEKLAERIGVSRTAISRFELGEIEPSVRNLAALAKELGVTSDYLLGLPLPAPIPGGELTPGEAEALWEFVRRVKSGQS